MKKIKGTVKLTFTSEINFLGKKEKGYQFEIIRDYKDEQVHYLDQGIDCVTIEISKNQDGEYESDFMHWEGGNIYDPEYNYILECAANLAKAGK